MEDTFMAQQRRFSRFLIKSSNSLRTCRISILLLRPKSALIEIVLLIKLGAALMFECRCKLKINVLKVTPMHVIDITTCSYSQPPFISSITNH
jgi:hypothetical protein